MPRAISNQEGPSPCQRPWTRLAIFPEERFSSPLFCFLQYVVVDSPVRDFELVPLRALNRLYAASLFDVVGLDAHSESWSRRNLQHPVLTLQSRGVALYGYAACALELLVSSGVLHIRREMQCVEVTKSGS